MSGTAEARILVLNAGSSSIKCGIYEAATPAGCLVRVHCDLRDDGGRITTTAAGAERVESLPLPAGGEARPPAVQAWPVALEATLGRAVAVAGGRVVAVGHRIVHGGLEFSGPVAVDEAVLAALAALEPLAPLHQPQNVAGIRAAELAVPGAVQVACFDTAFHRTCPPEAMRFAIPRRWHDAGIRRYGFHGLSYESIVARLPEVAGGIPERTIVAHLGAGASLCGIRAGRSVATTMGFTPLDGLVMATRCGSIDPGAVLQLILREGLPAAAVERLLARESGLLGVSGSSGDMRVLLASADPAAAEAVELFCYQAARETGSLVAALGGLDAIVFTAGIGEHSPVIRRRIAERLAWLGLELDQEANDRHGPRITAAGSRVAAWVIPTDEEGVIAAHAAGVWREAWQPGAGGAGSETPPQPA
jgi:acetate kinase